MEEFFKIMNQPLPIGIVIIVGLIVLWFRLNDATKAIREIKKKCDERLGWCIDHFKPKDT